MEDLVTYWRREGQHLEAAQACGDETTVEYATKARETADEIERLRAAATLVFQRLSELNRDDEMGCRMVLKSALSPEGKR